MKFPSEDSSKHFTKVILHDVLVLRTSGSADGQGTAVNPSGADGWVMLRVTDRQSQILYHVYANDDWWLALRPGLNDSNSPDSVDDAMSILRGGIGRDDANGRLNGGN